MVSPTQGSQEGESMRGSSPYETPLHQAEVQEDKVHLAVRLLQGHGPLQIELFPPQVPEDLPQEGQGQPTLVTTFCWKSDAAEEVSVSMRVLPAPRSLQVKLDAPQVPEDMPQEGSGQRALVSSVHSQRARRGKYEEVSQPVCVLQGA